VSATSDLGSTEMIACSRMNRVPGPVMKRRWRQFEKPNASQAHERARGATAFRVEVGKQASRIEHFDPQAEQIILAPQVVCG
jgi:hypothetical protein